MKRNLMILLSGILLIGGGCSAAPPTPRATILESENYKAELIAQDEEDVRTLSGRWVSLDDDKSVIEFVDGMKIDYYDGEKMSEGIVGRHNQKSLTVNVDGELFEYSIVEQSESILVLTYLARGNTLRYERLVE